ncbi:MAG: cytochrome c peroxidase [Chitinophagales bacterium]
MFKFLAIQKVLGVLLVFMSINACKDELPEPKKEYPQPTAFEIAISSAFPSIPIPVDNPTTVEGIALGRMLFYDPIISRDSSMSCASCHVQEHAFSDPNRFSIGVDDLPGTRQAMALVNVAYPNKLMWDGRNASLEEQALGPVEHPLELNIAWEEVEKRLQRSAVYPEMFGNAFGNDIPDRNMAVKAIAQFERTLISQTSKFDLARQNGSGVFFSEEELRGYELFENEKGNCFHCHGSILFTDNSFGNNGLDAVANASQFSDLGLGAISGKTSDNGLFRAPTLRNIVLTAPYMHDGRFNTLEEVLDHYSSGIETSPTLHPIIQSESPGGVGLTAQQKSDLIAFLHTLTDTVFVNNPDFANPFE